MAHKIEQPNQVKQFNAPTGWGLLPLWTMFGGLWAFSRSALTDSPAAVAIAAALVAGGWQPFWKAVTQTEWAVPLRQWKDWTEADAIRGWPYLEPGTPGASLHLQIAQAKAWWRSVGRHVLRQPLEHGLLGLLVSLLLGAALGREALLLSVCFVTLTELAALWREGRGGAGVLWSSIVLVGLPWLMGSSITGEGSQGIGAALVLALTTALYAQSSWRSILAPMLSGAFLVWQGYPYAAGWLMLSALPALVVLTTSPEEEAYHAIAGFSMLAAVTLIAAVL